MRPVETYSPVAFGLAVGLGGLLFVVLMLIAWTTGTDEVTLALQFRLQLTAAAFILGGGAVYWGLRYRKNARDEAQLAEMVRRNLGG